MGHRSPFLGVSRLQIVENPLHHHVLLIGALQNVASASLDAMVRALDLNKLHQTAVEHVGYVGSRASSIEYIESHISTKSSGRKGFGGHGRHESLHTMMFKDQEMSADGAWPMHPSRVRVASPATNQIVTFDTISILQAPEFGFPTCLLHHET